MGQEGPFPVWVNVSLRGNAMPRSKLPILPALAFSSTTHPLPAWAGFGWVVGSQEVREGEGF